MATQKRIRQRDNRARKAERAKQAPEADDIGRKLTITAEATVIPAHTTERKD